MLSILEKGEFGMLSTVSSSNEPYGVPLNYCFIDQTIYFHCALEGEKLNNIEKNSSVSFCVVCGTRLQPEKFSTIYESCIVQGSATEVFNEEKQLALEGLVKKYSNEFQAQGADYIRKAQHKTRVMKIVPRSISGKAKR